MYIHIYLCIYPIPTYPIYVYVHAYTYTEILNCPTEHQLLGNVVDC